VFGGACARARGRRVDRPVHERLELVVQ